VFLETAPRIFGLALEHDIGSEREVMRHITSIPIDRRCHFGDARLLERSPGRLRLADLGKLEPAGRRKAKSAALRRKSRCVTHSCHFYTGFRDIPEALEPRRVDRRSVR